MKKHTVAVWVLAAVLSLGTATISAMAAEGRAQSGSSWVYYDSSGNRVYNAWKKEADNQWRYLDGEGNMVTSVRVDSNCYIDSNDIIPTDKWLKLTNDDGEYGWYYFGNGGKMMSDVWKKIDNKWYHFDGDGRVELGWILDGMYYTGTDGAMRTGWQKLDPPDEDDGNRDHVTPGIDSVTDDDGGCRYYFSSSGKKLIPDSSDGDYTARKTDGTYYCLDETGVMQIGWKNVRSSSDDSIEDYMYLGADGKARIDRYSIEPPGDLEGYDGDVEWFRFTNSGKPRAADTERLTTNDIVRLNGKSYSFNHLGNPVYGLKKAYTGSRDDDWTIFCFDDKNKSRVQKGKIKVTEDDGNKLDFYFADNDCGHNGVKDNYLYYKGKLQKTTDGQKYVCYRVDNKNYMVNPSGEVMKSIKVKNSDGVKFVINANGQPASADEDTDTDSYVTEPTEPCRTEDQNMDHRERLLV